MTLAHIQIHGWHIYVIRAAHAKETTFVASPSDFLRQMYSIFASWNQNPINWITRRTRDVAMFATKADQYMTVINLWSEKNGAQKKLMEFLRNVGRYTRRIEPFAQPVFNWPVRDNAKDCNARTNFR